MIINYVTKNKYKIMLANKIFKDLDVKIEQVDLETPEIQSLDCEEVSKYSCKYACEKLNKPVLKNDSGLVINALNGFPGALAKYCEDTIKAEGFVKLLEGKDKSCYWIEVLSYCEKGQDPISFTSITKGTISDFVREGRGYDYDKIFIPENDTRTFSEMTEEEQASFFDDKAYLELYECLKNKKTR